MDSTISEVFSNLIHSVPACVLRQRWLRLPSRRRGRRDPPRPRPSRPQPLPRGPEALARAPEARPPRPGQDGGGCRHRAAVPGHVQAPERGGITGFGSASPFTFLLLLSLLLGYLPAPPYSCRGLPGVPNPRAGPGGRRAGAAPGQVPSRAGCLLPASPDTKPCSSRCPGTPRCCWQGAEGGGNRSGDLERGFREE